MPGGLPREERRGERRPRVDGRRKLGEKRREGVLRASTPHCIGWLGHSAESNRGRLSRHFAASENFQLHQGLEMLRLRGR